MADDLVADDDVFLLAGDEGAFVEADLADDLAASKRCGVWTKPLARRTLRVRLARSTG